MPGKGGNVFFQASRSRCGTILNDCFMPGRNPARFAPESMRTFEWNRCALSSGIDALFQRNAHLRSALQAKGTKSAKRHLPKVAKRWTRFQACLNHQIANSVLASLQAGDTLALEDLTGIRERCRHRKKQRGRFHRWSFAQLGAFLAYKAERKGVLLIQVDPAYSSQTCHKCGHCEKKNRKSQSLFVCQSCGYTANADDNAAQNLRQRGISSPARLMSDSQSQPTALSAAFAQAPEKAIYEASGREIQRAASPQALAVGH